MDYDLWLRIGKRFPRRRHVDAVWAVQRIHDDAKTISQYDDFWPERLAGEPASRRAARLAAPDPPVRPPPLRAQRVVDRAVAAAYALAGKRRKAA